MPPAFEMSQHRWHVRVEPAVVKQVQRVVPTIDLGALVDELRILRLQAVPDELVQSLADIAADLPRRQ